MHTLLVLAGWGQITLALGTLAIPRVLGWPQETRRLEPLTHTVFWTYATYIWLAHVCFGVVSIALTDELLDGSPLARTVTGFIAGWWGLRLALQLRYRQLGPQGPRYLAGEIVLTLAFAACAVCYGLIAVGVIA